jgi:dihydroorotase
MRYLIRGGQLIDGGMTAPLRADLLLDAGRIAAIGSDLPLPTDAELIDATGLWLTPGFEDLYAEAHFAAAAPRETIADAAAAAQQGGYRRWHLLPGCDPQLDSAAALAAAQREINAAGADVGLIGALTIGNAGKQLSPLAELAAAGAVAFSDGGRPPADAGLLRKAMAYSASFGLPLLLQPDDPQLSAGGLAHDGPVALRLGLPGLPAAAESSAAARMIALAEVTGARLHLTRVSAAATVDQIRLARQRGLAVTASVTAHHLLLDDRWLLGSMSEEPAACGLRPALLPPYDSATRQWPPLRTAADREALIAAAADGTIAAIAADHSPRLLVEQELEYGHVRPGISAFETTAAVGLTLVAAGLLSAPRLVAMLTDGPAAVFGRTPPRLIVGAAVGLTIIDPTAAVTVEPQRFRSRGRNTPLRGQTLRGRVQAVLQNGLLRPAGQEADRSAGRRSVWNS